MPQARFFCRTGKLAGSEHRIGTEATIGRAAGNTIVLPSGVVSKRHARIVFDEAAGAYTLEDLLSRNGTHLDGRPVESRVRLSELHVITIGERHDFFFVAPSARAPGAERANATRSTDRAAGGRADAAETRVGAPETLRPPPLDAAETRVGAPPALLAPPLEEVAGDAGAASAGATSSDPPTALDAPPVVAAPPLAEGSTPGGPEAEPGAPAPPAMRAPGVAVVLALPDGGRRRIELVDGRHVVGRGVNCAISIDDRMLSREHAAFVVRGGAVTVEDLNSMNGTTFEGRPVTDAVPVPLGRAVTLGGCIEAVITSGDEA